MLAAAAAAAAAGVGAVGGSKSTLAAQSYALMKPAKEAKLRLSAQDRDWAGKDLTDRLNNMEKWGFEGLEVGGRGLAGRVKELQSALKGRPIKMSAICAGFEGWLIATDKAARDKCISTMKEILSAAGELGSTGVIIVPSFNGQDEKGSLAHKEARAALSGFARWDDSDRKRNGALLAELGDHAAKAGTRVLLEPLNRQECYFLRTLADGASICRDLENPGVALMGDFWHMTWEETSDMGAFITGGDHLHHVHMASRRRRAMPGEDGEADNYVNGFTGLKMIGYQDFVSFECGCKSQDPYKAVQTAVDLLRKQWAEA